MLGDDWAAKQTFFLPLVLDDALSFFVITFWSNDKTPRVTRDPRDADEHAMIHSTALESRSNAPS